MAKTLNRGTAYGFLASTVRPLAGLPLRRTNGVKEIMEDVSCTPIGAIRTPFPCSRGAPARPEPKKKAGVAWIFPRHAKGPADPGSFSHVISRFHLHLPGADMVGGTPLLDIKPHIPE